MRALLCALLSFCFLAACLDEAESKDHKPEETQAPPKAESNLTQKICQNKLFPGSMGLHPDGGSPYSRVCNLRKLTGITIEGVDQIQLCQSELMQNNMPGETKYVDAKKVKEVLGPAAERADLLAVHGFLGKKFAVLILRKGHHASILATKEELVTQPVKLTSAEGALAWAYLSGDLGRGMASGFEPKALCGAELVEDSTGWTLSNAEVFENCRPRELREIRITRGGQVNVLNTEVKRDAAALCID